MFIYVAFLGQKQQLIIQNEQLTAQKRQFDIEHVDQQEQFRLQQNEIAAQQRQFEIQQQSIKQQNFESSFFKLLNLQMTIVGGLHVNLSGAGFSGRSCFSALYAELFNSLGVSKGVLNLYRGSDPTTLDQHREFVVKHYLAFYEKHEPELSHYFRNLYHIVKFVKESGCSYQDQRRYTSLMRAQLSAFELALLFYDGISPLGEKFKPRIEEFGLLEHLEKKHIPVQEWLCFYSQEAYH